MSQTAEAAGLRPDTHVLIDALNDIHPSPLEAGALETTPLLGDDSPRPSRKAKPRKWWQRRRTPHAAWCVPAAGRAGRLAAWLRLDEALADDLVLTTYNLSLAQRYDMHSQIDTLDPIAPGS